MNCKGWQKQILLRQTNELSRRQQTLLDRHIKSCTSCQQFERLLTAVDVPVEATDAETPIPTIWTLKAAALQQLSQTPKFTASWRPAVALAAILVLLLGSYFIFIPRDDVAQSLQNNDNMLLAWEDNFDSEISDFNSALVFATEEFGESYPVEDADTLANELLEFGES